MARPADPKPRLKRGYWNVRIKGKDHHLGKDRRKAFARYHQLMAEQFEEHRSDKPQSIAGAIEVWLRLHPNEKHRVWLRRFAEHAGHVLLSNVGDDLLHNYHDYLLRTKWQRTDPKSGEPVGDPKPYAQETVRNYMRDAVAVIRLAHRRKWCATMPESPNLAKPEFVDRSADRATLWKRLDDMPTRAQRILGFIAATGCRPGEACGLRWEHVKFAARACVLPRHKTSKRTGQPRIIALTDEALDILRETPQTDGGYVFVSRFGKPYTVQGLRSICLRHLECNPYDLRHTFAQACIDTGIVPEVVTKMMGHKTSAMVWTYAEIKNEKMVEAAGRLRLRPASGQ